MPLFPDAATLLAAHGLSGATREPMTHDGFSGAELVRLRRDDGASFVLKTMSVERDWIMRATDDVRCREAALAPPPFALPTAVQTPSLGAARDGDGYALLMADIAPSLLPPGPIGESTLDTIIAAMAALHATVLPPGAMEAPYWCGLAERLTLLTPAGADVAARCGAPVAADLVAGWALFRRHATPRGLETIDALAADPAPLVGALGMLEPALLHGDLKLDNIGVDGDGRIWLIDWAMALVAPPAVDLAWFLAVNSRRLPVALDEVMRRYADASSLPPAGRARHDALVTVCALLLRGWRKALDAEAGDGEELAWWCERVEAAAEYV